MKSRAGIQIELNIFFEASKKSVFVHVPALFLSQDDTKARFHVVLFVGDSGGEWNYGEIFRKVLVIKLGGFECF
jgi:hypothetical protein